MAKETEVKAAHTKKQHIHLSGELLKAWVKGKSTGRQSLKTELSQRLSFRGATAATHQQDAIWLTS